MTGNKSNSQKVYNQTLKNYLVHLITRVVYTDNWKFQII